MERRPLTRAQIVETAVSIVDREGLVALTMRRLGRELGIEAMSLYSHFPNKATLLFAMVNWLIDQIHPVCSSASDWKERIKAVMQSYRQVGLQHPNVFFLLVSRPWDGVAMARLNEDLGTLLSAGFSPEEAGYALTIIISYATGFIMREIRSSIRERFGSFELKKIRAMNQTLDNYPNLSVCHSYMLGVSVANDHIFDLGIDLITRQLEENRGTLTRV